MTSSVDHRNIEKAASWRSLLNYVRQQVRRWGLRGLLARLLLLKDETRKFLNKKTKGFTRQQKRALLAGFQRVHFNVPCAHSPFQFTLMSEFIMNLEVAGPIVECGCFKGGSTAKLSLLAKLTNRRLVVCDSFVGLPDPKSTREAQLTGHRADVSALFAKGQYSLPLEQVKENVRKHGCIDVCDFVVGFYEDSLPSLDVNPACVFIDVDLISSARDCLQHLWPRTIKGGLWFTHEAGYPDYILGILDPEWWQENLNQTPPVIFGAGSGLSTIAASVAYFRK